MNTKSKFLSRDEALSNAENIISDFVHAQDQIYSIFEDDRVVDDGLYHSGHEWIDDREVYRVYQVGRKNSPMLMLSWSISEAGHSGFTLHDSADELVTALFQDIRRPT